RLIMQYASEHIIPVTLELGGKSPNIFFEDVFDQEDDFLDKAVEGLVFFALNQGEVCTCPSRALDQQSIYESFVERAIEQVKQIKIGHTLHTETMMGAQASEEQLEKMKSYLDIGKQEGAEVLVGGNVNKLPGELQDGHYVEPTIFTGHNKMRIFKGDTIAPV